jgi:hypothetical protein
MIAMLPQRTRVFRPRPQLAAVHHSVGRMGAATTEETDRGRKRKFCLQARSGTACRFFKHRFSASRPWIDATSSIALSLNRRAGPQAAQH